MSGNLMWIAIGVAIVVVVVIAAIVLRGRPRPVAPEVPAVVEVPEPKVEAAVIETPAPVPAPAPAPPAPPVVVAPPPKAPPPPPPAPPPPPPAVAKPVVQEVPRPVVRQMDPVPVTIVPTPVRPPAPVIERVLVLESAGVEEWEAAAPLDVAPAQAANVAAVIAPLSRLGADAVHAVRFAPGAAMRVARNEWPYIQSLAAANARAASRGVRWLDSTAVTTIAGTALASMAASQHLDALGDEVRDLKAALAAMPPKRVTQDGGRLKALVQDVSRFAREARENYATVVGKPAFRERVIDASERASQLWREIVAAVDETRQPLDPLRRSTRFGEAQVDKALSQWRELYEFERLQEIAARSLAALHMLRTSIGEVTAGAVDQLASASAALQGGVEQDVELVAQFVEREKDAKGDPYVGKGEFEANRAALRKLLARAAGEAVAVAAKRVEAAHEAQPLDPSSETARGLRILIKPEASSGGCEIRAARAG